MSPVRTAFLLIASVLAFACDRAADPDQARITPAPPVVVHLQVDGMHCQGCVDAITDQVKRVDGVVDCKVTLESRQADVAMREASAGPEVRKAIEKLGYKVTPLK
jgi:copper chaperone CopZ